ncbi:MAG: histidine kinase [Bacteroidota bacterium]
MKIKKLGVCTLGVCLFLITGLHAQKPSLAEIVSDLQTQIHQSDGSQKLQLLDSLSYLTRDMAKFQYDSIVKETVAYAIELDSFDLANRQAARLVWSLTNRLGKPNEGKAYFEEFDAKQLPVIDNKLLARFYLNGGDSYYFSEDIEKAIEIYDLASSYALKANDSILYGISRKYIADAYIRMGNLVDASRMLQEVEAIYRNTKDTIRLVNTKSSRADLYSMNGFYEEAKAERNEALALSKAVNYESGIINSLLNESIDNSIEDDTETMIKNLNEALQYAQNSTEVKDRYEPQILNKLLQGYSEINDLEKATEIYKKLQENPERNTQGYFEDIHHKSLALFYLTKKDLPNALTYATKYYNYHSTNNTILEITNAHEILFQIYEAMNDSKQALYHFKKATHINDSILSLKRTKALSYYQTLYETEKRDATIASQESEITILDSKNRIKQQWMLFGGLGLLAIFLIIYLIRSKKFAQKNQELQEKFSQDLINGQEEERLRLARELHDSVGQKLMLISKQTKKIDHASIENLATSTLEEVRTISRGLHPSNLERLGFTEAVNALVYDINANTDVFFTEKIENIDTILSKEAELHVYRIIQEVLSNIVKHADAKAVKIEVQKKDKSIHVLVSDNGKGFDLTTTKKSISLGMNTLFERAKIIGSQLNINSELNKGTTVKMNIPI